MDKSWKMNLQEWCNVDRMLAEWDNVMKEWENSIPTWEVMDLSSWHHDISPESLQQNYDNQHNLLIFGQLQFIDIIFGQLCDKNCKIYVRPQHLRNGKVPHDTIDNFRNSKWICQRAIFNTYVRS